MKTEGDGAPKGAAIAFVVILAAACAGGDDGGGDPGAVELVRLEPIGASTPDPFTADLDLDPPGASLAIALPDVPPLGTGVGSTLSGRVTAGDEPGLYGGSRDDAVCDLDQLVAFLTDGDNAAQADAWVDVLDIEVDDIDDDVGGLTAVRLRHDTRVTNHGFRDGRAVPVQSVLQAGTAVLVDDAGLPVVKCSCGNPLGPPEPLGGLDEDDALDVEGLASNPDDAWEGFDPARVVDVEPADDAVDEFVLLDIATGERFARPAGTNGQADKTAPDDGEADGDEATCALLDAEGVRLVGEFTRTDDIALVPNRIELVEGATGVVTGEWALLRVGTPLEGEIDESRRRITGRTVPSPFSFDDDLGRIVEVRGFVAELDEQRCAYVGRFDDPVTGQPGGGVLEVPGSPGVVARVPGGFELRSA